LLEPAAGGKIDAAGRSGNEKPPRIMAQAAPIVSLNPAMFTLKYRKS
jgi:hypothetical protein